MVLRPCLSLKGSFSHVQLVVMLGCSDWYLWLWGVHQMVVFGLIWQNCVVDRWLIDYIR
uniref:Uncharacterized protein n=1 Tax=Arundo donax TaxID=35708 RepID=A0A0A9GFS4_ARUDO